MATRQEIREAFYAELETAASGLVDTDSISQNYPETTEDFPSITHNDSYRRVPMNNTTGVTDVTRDNQGVVQLYHYSVTMEAQFTVLISSISEMEKESIYEAVRQHFELYELPISDLDTIHEDAYYIEVLDSNSQDDQAHEPIVRGDSLTVNLRFERIYDLEVDAIESIDAELDVEITETGDGTTDISYTTS